MMIRHRKTDTGLEEEEPEKRHRLARYSPEINAGTIIQIVVILSSVVFGYAKLESGLALGAQRVDTIEKRVNEQELRTIATLNEMKADGKDTGQKINEMGQKVNDLKTKIDLLDLKISQPRK